MSKLTTRLQRLEQHIGPRADPAAEAAQHGRPLWSTPAWRAYARDTPAGARLAVVGAGRPLVYALPGVHVGDLS